MLARVFFSARVRAEESALPEFRFNKALNGNTCVIEQSHYRHNIVTKTIMYRSGLFSSEYKTTKVLMHAEVVNSNPLARNHNKLLASGLDDC